ncbi:MAG: pyruvate:ferredoxin (flavodoxin) oxidoreductase, partial [Pirellulaceae bacterium]
LTGRAYRLFEYEGAPDARQVVVILGSGGGAASEAVQALIRQGRAVGVLKVRLYRPWDVASFLAALPATTQSLAVLDRTKEPGAIGEPLYLDVVAAVAEGWHTAKGTPLPQVYGGRYGLASKEFTPAMVQAIFDRMDQPDIPRRFTVGIFDDVTHLSLPWDEASHPEAPDVKRAIFFGLGSDGTVSANKNSVKIIGQETPLFAQGYFVYDSKKSGSTTISHLRF